MDTCYFGNIFALRNHVRQRKSIVHQITTETQRMQKALEQMNIKLNNVISSITGKTGLKIIIAILAGERDPNALVRHRDGRLKASKETLLKSLEGNWREEQVFNLKIAHDHYLFLQKQLKECDAETEKVIQKMTCRRSVKEVDKVQRSKNGPNFNVSQYLYDVLGVEVTKIHGIKETTALTIFAETGADLKEKFPTEKQFLSWVNVVPNNKITGGKVISSRVRKKKNKAGQAFRDAAGALWQAHNAMGDYLRRKKARSGGKQAVVATARKIASIYYKVVTEKTEFDPAKLVQNTEQYLKVKLKSLEKLKKTTEKLLAECQEVRLLVR